MKVSGDMAINCAHVHVHVYVSAYVCILCVRSACTCTSVYLVHLHMFVQLFVLLLLSQLHFTCIHVRAVASSHNLLLGSTHN